jgi:hypothetical protein
MSNSQPDFFQNALLCPATPPAVNCAYLSTLISMQYITGAVGGSTLTIQRAHSHKGHYQSAK